MFKLIKILFISLSGIFLLILIIFIKDYTPSFETKTYKIEEVVLLNKNLILSQRGNTIKPIKYIGKVNFASIETEERKEKFIDYLLPAIVLVKDRLINDLHRVEFIEGRINRHLELSVRDALFLKETMKRYNAETVEDLKIKLYPPPVSLILAQAALESGWGTSRIFRLANNPFGIVASSADDMKIMNILLSDEENEVYMRSYSHVIEAVEHYCYITAKLKVYENYRVQRWKGSPSTELLKYLNKYHQASNYQDIAKMIIRTNNLRDYDIMTIDSQYLKGSNWFLSLMKN